MHSRARTPLALAAAAALALASSALEVPAAQAGPPGTWTSVSAGSSGKPSSLTAPSSVRLANGDLLVVWVNSVGLKQSLYSRIIRRSTLLPTTTARTVLPTTWATLTSDPKVLLVGGHPAVVFSGLRTTVSGDPWTGPLGYATSPDGLTWTFQDAQSLSSSSSAYASYGIDAVMNGGELVTAYTRSSAFAITVHRGISGSVPAGGTDAETTPLGDSYNAALVRDSATGVVWTTWYSSSSVAAKDGVFAQPMVPTKGALKHAPASTVRYSGASYASVAPDQRIAAASRVGGGAWVAYGSGYPTARTLVLWNPASGRTLRIARAHGVRRVALATGSGGRLWLSWTEDQSTSIYAVRTNASVTAFGAVRSVPIPGRSNAGPYVYKTVVEGSRGPLDLVVQGIASFSATTQVYHQRILAGLTVTVSPLSLKSTKGGTVTVRVLDAGLAVAGATVTFRGQTKHTGGKGTVAFVVKRGTTKGTYPVRASASGFANVAGKVRVL